MKRFVLIFLYVFSILSGKYLHAQISVAAELYNKLPDSVRPKDMRRVTDKEAARLMEAVGVLSATDSSAKIAAAPLIDALRLKAAEESDRSLRIENLKTLVIYYFNYWCNLDTSSASSADSILSIADRTLLLIKDDRKYDSDKYELYLYKANPLYWAMGRYEEAADLYNRCFYYYSAEKDSANLGVVAIQMSSLHSKLALYKEAIYWSKLSNDVYFKKDSVYFFSNLVLQAADYISIFREDSLQKNNLDSSRKIIGYLSANFTGLNYKFSLLTLQAEQTYFEKDYPYAKKLIDAAFAYLKPDSYRAVTVNEARVYQAWIYSKTQNRKEAVTLFKKLVKNNFVYDMAFYDFLYKDALENKHWQEALTYLQAEKKSQEKYYSVVNRGKVFAANQKYRVAEKEKDILRLRQTNRLYIVIAVIILAAILFTFFMISRFRRLKSQHRESEYQKHVQELESILIKQELEMRESKDKILNDRKNIGRVLHDDLSGSLAAVKYIVSDLKKQSDSENEKSKWKMVEEELSSIYNDARAYSHRLSYAEEKTEQTQNNFDIFSYLQGIREQFNTLGIMNIHLNVDEKGLNEISPEESKSLFYILKECFTNAVKHAYAKNIYINFFKEKSRYILNFKDDGVGISENKQQGLGLENLKNYIGRLQGTMEIISTDGTGYRFMF